MTNFLLIVLIIICVLNIFSLIQSKKDQDVYYLSVGRNGYNYNPLPTKDENINLPKNPPYSPPIR